MMEAEFGEGIKDMSAEEEPEEALGSPPAAAAPQELDREPLAGHTLSRCTTGPWLPERSCERNSKCDSDLPTGQSLPAGPET